jgi:hypothetical protein
MPVHMAVPALDTGESRALPDVITANEATGAAEGDSAAADNGTAADGGATAENGTTADGGATAENGATTTGNSATADDSAMTDSGMADNGAALSGGGSGSFALEPLSLAPYVSPENRSFLVEYRVPGGAERSLRPGMFATVSFVLERRENVYYLPFKVLASGNRLWYAGEDGKAGYIEFTPEFFNDDYFQIPEELGNKTFIIEGQHFITPGQELRILAP